VLVAFPHIAGRDCQAQQGYNGRFVTVEEIRGCTTYQSIVPVNEGKTWVPEPHDHDFENRKFDLGDDIDYDCFIEDRQFFLSGLSDRKAGNMRMALPCRHDVRRIGKLPRQFGNRLVAFHPTCFDILSRVWEKEFSDSPVNLTTLMQWLSARIHYKEPYHPDVEKSYKGSDIWHHRRGLEYLATNPLFVPYLGSIFRAAIQDNPAFSTHFGAFTLSKVAMKPYCRATITDDPFDLLPLELGLQILEYLEPNDIANLRFAIRSFSQLPIFFFRKLLLREMPWLWEAWSDKPPFIWATVPFAALRDQRRSVRNVEWACEDYLDVIEEEMPEVLPEWHNAAQRVLADFKDSQQDLVAQFYADAKTTLVTGLPADKTNWYQLYYDIKRHWADLKGLQNRKRIWV
jgi:hypothetical protein